MIELLILVLALLLVGLLVDWQKILKRTGAKGLTFPKVKKLEKKTVPKKPVLKEVITKPSKTQKPVGPDFSLDIPEPEIEPVEHTILEEEASGYQPPKEVQDLLAEADICFRKGEMKAAENYYIQAAAKDPRCSKAYSRLGVIYLENGENWEDAEAAFRQALKTDPDNGFILNNLGLVLYHQDKYADAVRHFEQAVRQDELNAARYANLGMAYMAMRQYAKAESSFKRALKLAPNEMEYKDLLTESIEKKKAHKTMIRH